MTRRDVLRLVAVTYLTALVAALYGHFANEGWPFLFALFLAACGALLHVADVLYENGDRSDD